MRLLFNIELFVADERSGYLFFTFRVKFSFEAEKFRLVTSSGVNLPRATLDF